MLWNSFILDFGQYINKYSIMSKSLVHCSPYQQKNKKQPSYFVHGINYYAQ